MPDTQNPAATPPINQMPSELLGTQKQISAMRNDLAALTKHVKKAVEDPEDPNILVDEFLVQPNGTILVMPLQTDRPVLIKSIIFSIPTGSTGVLSIGQSSGGNIRSMAIAPGQGPLTNVAMVIYPQDQIKIVTNNPGLIFVEIMGSGLKGDEWRVI